MDPKVATPDVSWRYIKAETETQVYWPKRENKLLEFLDSFHFTFPSISVHVHVPSLNTAGVQQSVWVIPPLFGPKPACGLAKQGWQRTRRPLLASACRAPVDQSTTSECRSHHPGRFKHIIQPTVDHSLLPANHEDSWVPVSSLCIFSRHSLPTAVSGMLACEAAVSLGTLGRFSGTGSLQ